MQTKVFSSVLRSLGAGLGTAAFGIALLGALLAGVDPFWALLRAVSACAILMTAFSILCKLIMPLASAIGASDKSAKAADGQ